jgi:tyrosinase
MRYQRVKQILNEAAGDAQPSYQGYGKFWELPLSELLEVTIYGIRMIAPASAGGGGESSASKGAPTSNSGTGNDSCCHSPGDGPGASDTGRGSRERRHPGRGAASGLVKGLKGESPFDGSQFPRLPWGGQAVSASDIQFIENWIDDGCPEDGASQSEIELRESSRLARANGDEEHPPHTGPTNQFYDEAGTLKVRKNIAFLSNDELQRFRGAIAQMKRLNAFFQDERSFDFWARIHGNLCQHGWEEFLTWHRLYLYHFEQQLQDIDRTVTLPYWDWAMDRKNVEISIMDESADKAMDNGVIPEAYQCWINEEGLESLRAGGSVPADTLAKLAPVRDSTFSSGPRLFKAANIVYGANKDGDKAIMEELARINPLWHRLRWPGGDRDLIFEAYPTPEDVDRILKLESFFTFGSGPTSNHFFGALENIHNLIHNYSGGANPNYDPNTDPQNREEPQFGDMVNAGVTAFDPIFWGHHSNVDRLWSEWQNLHANSGPDNPTAILPPWTFNVGQTLSIDKFGYEYMKSSHVFPTDNTMSIVRFKSANTVVRPQVLQNHRRADIRLHKVRYKVRAGFHIRVFLNQPDADVHTPTRGNDHYVTTVHMFTGSCIGGPGHCDVPAETRRKFDLRPRDHKTPANFRIDVTENVGKLRAKGETNLRVNLVVLNTDGSPAKDALLLDAVSLNFID